VLHSSDESLTRLPASEREAILASLSEDQAEQLQYDWSFYARPKASTARRMADLAVAGRTYLLDRRQESSRDRAGGTNEARYIQIVGYGNFVGNGIGQQVLLRNDELIYIRPNLTSATPFGGPLEIAFNSVSRILGVGEFAGNVAMNARPSIRLDLGGGASTEMLMAFRQYWRNEVQGQGIMPIMGMTEFDSQGKSRSPLVLRFYPEGDEGLYLKYQEFLIREIATAFDISPQNLGVERDLNRNTSETAEDRDRPGHQALCAFVGIASDARGNSRQARIFAIEIPVRRN
jgi:hypothetical protein